ncbi:uncharacterized protein LOC131262207 [Anopheles coustani]|uniref:uncharacterized protein LOC131262207 n=1 Tax=Anopheles coustani TaxID=139045 RepID=UPI00265A0A33|nr:uncharacterized protein LOC131262207 [Anopheles coustani]
MESCRVLMLVLLAALVGNGSALLCRNCVSSSSFDHCETMGQVVQCNASIVNANHATFYPDNPTLAEGNGTEFKCYRIQVNRLFANGTATNLHSFARGCTFNTTNFCAGWVSSLNVTGCGTCMTDNCDQNPVGPVTTTLAPGVTTTLAPGVTTTLAPGVTTTLAPGVTTTTTKKPSSGAASVLQLGTATLTIVSILVLLAVR